MSLERLGLNVSELSINAITVIRNHSVTEFRTKTYILARKHCVDLTDERNVTVSTSASSRTRRRDGARRFRLRFYGGLAPMG